MASFVILGFTVAVGWFLSKKQAAEILVLKTELVKAENRLLELQEHQRDRVLDSAKFESALKGKPSGEAAVLYDELTGEEGYSLASHIALALQRANWKLSDFGPIAKVADSRINVPPITQAGSYTGSGITIATAVLEKRPFVIETPYSTLWNAFAASSLKFEACIPSDPLPANSFRILVGKRPPLACETK